MGVRGVAGDDVRISQRRWRGVIVAVVLAEGSDALTVCFRVNHLRDGVA